MVADRRALLFVLAATLVAAAVGASGPAGGDGGGAPLPPPRPTCSTDAECGGCLRCRGGLCDDAEWSGQTCMCDAECGAVGARSCDLSPLKPLCGGQCSDASARPLACNAGDDVARVEPLDDRSSPAPAAAAISPEVIVVETGARP